MLALYRVMPFTVAGPCVLRVYVVRGKLQRSAQDMSSGLEKTHFFLIAQPTRFFKKTFFLNFFLTCV